MTTTTSKTWPRLGSIVYVLIAVGFLATGAHGQTPAKTTIADTVYRADGSPAAGTLLITWPDFNTADNKTVAAGMLSTAIGSGGAVSLALVPNQGATPAGTYYKVVYQLNDGSNNSEFWVVPSASPTTITAIRSQIVPANVAAQLASRAYVDGQVAGKADLSSVVQKSGDTMTGPLVLSGTPTANNQAATKSYVDTHTGSTPGQIIVDGLVFTTIQAAITAAGVNGTVLIPSSYTGTDTYTNPNGILIIDNRNRAFTANNLAQIRFAAMFPGADLGTKINAADTDLGAAAGEIWVIGGGNIATQVTLSSNHILRFFEGTVTNALGERTPIIRMQDHTSLIGVSKQAIIQESTNAADGDPVIICAFYAGVNCNSLAGAATDIHISGIHFQGATVNGSSLIDSVSLLNCVKCSVRDSWFDNIRSSHILVGGTSGSGNFADQNEISGNWFSGHQNASIAIINGQNLSIHDNYWSAPGNGAAAQIDIEPNSTTDHAQNIDLHDNVMDLTNAVTSTYCITVQNGPFVAMGQIKIHDNLCFGGPFTTYGTVSNHLLQCFATGPGPVNLISDIEIYNNVCRVTVQGGIALNATNRGWVHDNTVQCVAGPAISLSGNVTNSVVERNRAMVGGTGCPTNGNPLYVTTIVNEQGTGNANNIFRDNLVAATPINGANSYAVSSTLLDGSGQSFHVPVGLNGGISGTAQMVPLAAPVLGTALNNATGSCVLAANGYFYRVTSATAYGESAGSNEWNVNAGGAFGCRKLIWSKTAGASKYNVYRSTTTNTEQLIATVSDGGTTYDDLGGQTPGATYPTANSTVVLGGPEGAAPGGMAASDLLWPDSSAHCWKINNNNGVPGCVGSLAGSLTAKAFLYADATPAIASTTAPANGELLIGSAGAIPVKGTIAGTANQITVSNGPGTITLGIPASVVTTSFTGNFISSSANPASSGALRLASVDAIAWRNNANTADVALSKNTSDQLVLPTVASLTIAGNLTAPAWISSTANVAGTGTVRLANADSVKVRNSLNTADLTAVSADSTGVVLGDATGGATMYGQLTMTNATVNVTGTGIVSTPSLNLAGDSATAQARMAWGSFLPGALTTTWTGAQFTPKKAVTIVQIEARTKTGPAGCTTYPVIQLTDGTTPVNTSLNNGNVTNTISGGQNYAANAVLLVKVSTAAAGCTTNPADVNVTVQYKMQ